MIDEINLMENIDNLMNDEENENINDNLLQFKYAPISVPRNFTNLYKNENKKLFDFNKGTTTLSFKTKDGIIIAVDSRASMGTFIASQDVLKILEINKFLVGTIAGGAADCFYWQKYLAKIIKIHELNNNDRMSVKAASTILSNILYQFKGYGLSCGIILSGYDHDGFNLFFVDDSGLKLEGNLFSCGSGSTYAYSVLDASYDFNMNFDDAIELARNAIYHATFRDAGSGGKVRIYYMGKNGYEIIVKEEDVYNLHYKYVNPEQKEQYVI